VAGYYIVFKSNIVHAWSIDQVRGANDLPEFCKGTFHDLKITI